jgi:hypothetical protein
MSQEIITAEHPDEPITYKLVAFQDNWVTEKMG